MHFINPTKSWCESGNGLGSGKDDGVAPRQLLAGREGGALHLSG